MSLEPINLSPPVREILSLAGDGNRLIPLVAGRSCSADATRLIHASTASSLFPGARSAQGALAGLWVYFSAFDEAHAVAQDLGTADGSYWHAIVHRQEPDPGNSSYWFRRVGSHPVFPALAQGALELGYGSGAGWDALAFIDYCEKARRQPGSDLERVALQVQRLEWQLLFDSCSGPMRR